MGNLADGLILLDKFFRVKTGNMRAEMILRHSLASLVGKHISEVLPSECTSRLNNDGPAVTKFTTTAGDLLLLYEPVALPDLGGIVILRDVCWENELSRDIECLKKSVNSLGISIDSAAPAEIFVTDGDGKTLEVGLGCKEFYGVSAAELIGRSVNELEKEKYFFPSLTPIVKQTRKQVTIIQETKTGKKLVASANPVFDEKGQIARIITISRDITEFYNLRKQLSKMGDSIRRYITEIADLKQDSNELEGLIVKSPVMMKVVQTLRRIASFDSTVLFLGESGTGKGTLARLLHRLSARSSNNFVQVNCGAIPENLMESEFFGYVPGAFTGAQKAGKKGLVELAHQGTLFLDEVDALSLNLQTKLLHVIQERTFKPVGATKDISVDIRILAATNKDLKKLVDEGLFREDLYYRLNVIPIIIPPLRERNEEIVPLATFFLERLCKRYGVQKELYVSTMNILKCYNWPGNVRELENVIERCVVTTSGSGITSECLIEHLQNNDSLKFPLAQLGNEAKSHKCATLDKKMADVEKAILTEALEKYGSTRKVAAHLGVNQSTVVRKMKKFGLSSNN